MREGGLHKFAGWSSTYGAHAAPVVQVRHLLEQVDSLCLQQQKSSGLRAAAVICGDFNSAAGECARNFRKCTK